MLKLSSFHLSNQIFITTKKGFTWRIALSEIRANKHTKTPHETEVSRPGEFELDGISPRVGTLVLNRANVVMQKLITKKMLVDKLHDLHLQI